MKKKCPGCGDKTELSSSVNSMRHKHHNSTGVKKNFLITGKVRDAVTNKAVSVCYTCRVGICTGMSSGGNIE